MTDEKYVKWWPFDKRFKCTECTWLAGPFITDPKGDNGICPECGSQNLKTVIARHKVKYVSHYFGGIKIEVVGSELK